MEKRYWQAAALASEVNVHYTTLNNWFNALEDKRIHYVNRAPDGDRVFDELDYQLASYIKSKREEKWSLDAIYSTIQDVHETRPFPEHYESPTQLRVEDMKALFIHEITKIVERQHQEQTQMIRSALQEAINQLSQALPTPPSPEEVARQKIEERLQHVNYWITQSRIMNEIKVEAMEQWSKLPESERFIKRGLFRREEDTLKKDRFIIDYQNKHFAERIRQEYGLINGSDNIK